MPNPLKTVWLADDDHDDRCLLEEAFLENSPEIQLLVFNDGFALVDQLNSTDILPDLVILDIGMPLKDGFDCLSEIRDNPKLNSMPIIIWSTGSMPGHKERAYTLGARLFVIKPNSFSRLREISKSIQAGIGQATFLSIKLPAGANRVMERSSVLRWQ
jgi:CheY-like chemotaxis protein